MEDVLTPDYARPGGPWDVPALNRLPLPAVGHDEQTWSSAEIHDDALGVARWIAGHGVGRGDVVAFPAPPSASAVVAYAACWAIGAVAAPLHHRLTDVERAAVLERVQPALVLPADPPAGKPVDAVYVRGSDPAVLLTTSGSSGRPKVVLHTHRALAYKARVMARAHGLTREDTILMPAPMAHVSGLQNGLLLPGAAGMRTVFLEQWDPTAALELIERERVTFMIGPPTFFVQMLHDPSFRTDRVASLRLLSCGGAGVSEAFCRTASEAFGARVKRTYGSTEAPTVTTTHADDPVERGWCTDGRAVGVAELRVDATTGEISVRGPELFAGYDDPAQTAAVVSADGWFATGDRGRLEDGWLTVLGRLHDTVIRGGENVDPAEVEAVCATLPGVRQAVVVGYPDDVMGERVGLVVVGAAPALDAVRAHCADAGLARFKTPERVVAVDELPVLTVGKPDRSALRRLLS